MSRVLGRWGDGEMEREGDGETRRGRAEEYEMETTMTMQAEAVPVVRSSLEMKRKALEFSLRQYQTRLAAFERRHRMTTEEFATKFGAGELGDEADWFEWEFVLDAYRETARQLRLVGSVHL
jgi:hypothetical protein